MIGFSAAEQSENSHGVVQAKVRRRARGNPRALVRAARDGSEDAIEELVRSHWAGAYRLALGVTANTATAEDVVQDSLISAVGGLADFDPRRAFRPWLHRIVVNRSIDALRAGRRRGEVELSDDTSVAPDPADLGVSDALAKALCQLDSRQRAVVTLRLVLGYSAREVGDILDTSETNVRTILHRSLTTLRDALSGDALSSHRADEGGSDE